MQDGAEKGRAINYVTRCLKGQNDQFTMSNALHRLTGFRPSALPVVSWPRLVDGWIARQRRRGRLAVRRADRPSE